jgi:hypothetical protein
MKKILNAYMRGGAGGRLVFDEPNQATFRPQGRDTGATTIVLACIPK